MKNKWPKRAPALLAAVALTASMFPTGALALEAERQDTAETVTAAVQQTPNHCSRKCGDGEYCHTGNGSGT